MRGAALVTVLALAVPLQADGQVAARIADVEDGTVRFAYATKPGVEICDQGIRWGESTMWWRVDRNGRYEGENCRSGAAEVEVEVRNGRVREVEIVRSLDDRDDRASDLGVVAAPEAAEYLLGLAWEGATDDAAEDAILPAMLADAGETWCRVADLAGDRGLSGGIRKAALFWLGQEAAAVVTEGLADVARDRDEDQDIREAAIFALAQRPASEGVPILMDLAKTAAEPETRKTAMFWLAQSEDDRVVDFFQDILTGRGR